MKREKEIECQEDIDRFHHLLQEQIAYISVMEEEERIREEMIDGRGK